MTLTQSAPSRAQAVPSFGLCVAILLVLTVVRLVGLHYSVVDLYVDESQYWAWSRDLAFGYFSKPPLLAWIIAAAEGVCGAGEACIRGPAPLFYFGTSLVCYGIARELYDERVAFWTALMVAFATGAAFSSRIISTDVPLLFFWALALLAYVKLLRVPDLRWAIVLGVALGLGLNAKYAMLYFVVGMLLAAFVDADARTLLRRPTTWLAFAIAAALIAPNIGWNIANGFVTFRHTGDNIQGGGLTFSLGKGLEFLAAQFAVFGPVVFGGMLVLFVRLCLGRVERADRLMLMFAIPALALVGGLAFVRTAHANWAAPSFISGVVVVTAVLVRQKGWGWIRLSIGIGLAVQAMLLVADVKADRVRLPFIAKGDVYERTMGWSILGTETTRLARSAGAAAVVSEGRGELASLLYYLRDEKTPVLAWPARSTPDNHFEVSHTFTDAAPEPVLFVSRCPHGERLSQYYASVEPLGTFDARTGPTTLRQYFAFKLSGPRGPIGLLGPCG